MQQEELVRLFSQNLTLSNYAPVAPPVIEQPQILQQQQQQQQQQQELGQQNNPQNPQPVVYSSTHYTHSAHLVPKSAPPQPPSPFSHAQLSEILTRHSIDPSTLFPSQLDLFQQSPDDARLRLLEIWRLSPPDYSNHALALELGNWPCTSLQQEEEMAKLRFERRARQQAYQQASTTGTDSIMEQDAPPLPPLSASSVSPPPDEMKTASAEPYMLSGYEALVKRDYDEHAKVMDAAGRYYQATDPVYKSTGLWEKQGLQEMENRYGAFAQMREFGAPQFVGVHGGLNEDMMMM
ncbi:hypothetical protein H2201_001072 [Coniosporium apollinis]|uniref:ASX DEUBAD domain-containing protein n=2 Tax=Coniosporium TaxID=2810619 RepID=A0ABQ9P668_9PEZI|nr:hypothetical protein H2199_003136 [Cladosporium sp. JES 115]KAJ9668826.1 hypothetical protein H2201_001072 [Coniosporium apollinis]